jgi:tight adherence protein C
MLALLAAVAVFVAVSSILAWAGGTGVSAAESRLSKLNMARARPSIDAPFSERVMVPVLDTITNAFMQVLPGSFVDRVSRRLETAGRPVSTQGFFAVLLVSTLFLPLSLLAILGLSGVEINFLAVLFACVLGFFGFMAPVTWLRGASNRRRNAILRRLPDAFDLITVSVEAGLGLDAAMRQVAEKLRGPLAEEIAQVLREVGMGRPRREALEDMSRRVNLRELETFVHAIIQAEQLGTSLGRVLRAQAYTLRVRRRQRAQETARRAPVKMVFPLVFFIMPTFFLVTLGPIVVHVIVYLSE